MASFQAKTSRGNAEEQRIKIIDPINFYPTRNRKFQRIAKKFKK